MQDVAMLQRVKYYSSINCKIDIYENLPPVQILNSLFVSLP